MEQLTSKGVLVVFTYALAGLGHLRVADALFDALPPGVDTAGLGGEDQAIVSIHRVSSIHPIARAFMEWMQVGPLSPVFAMIYKKVLRSRSKNLYVGMKNILRMRPTPPKKVLVVATHFGLAHQLAVVKEKLEKETGIKFFLVVQVTDDTAHPVWYIEGADLMFVPSDETREKFLKLAKNCQYCRVNIQVSPYPVNPALGEIYSLEKAQNKATQLDPSGQNRINVAVPISGAAVGTGFSENLIKSLGKLSPRYFFHVVSREAIYTMVFLERLRRLADVRVHASSIDRKIVNLYDDLYQNEVVSLEITKPSEQAFKILFDPRENGGVVLLFADPVGAQEKDNLAYLERHQIIPSLARHQELWKVAQQGVQLADDDDVFTEARGWRGLRLPWGAAEAANFIHWCLIQGVFAQMLLYRREEKEKIVGPNELGNDGAKRFWIEAERLLI